jgi:pimeloyl-ACP methyl ester carboxylesterase
MIEANESGEEIRAPAPSGLLGEARGLLELPNLLLRFPQLARQPKGRGQIVLVLPGYGAGDSSTAVLRAYVRFLGYRPRGMELGRNTGNVPDLLPRVVDRLELLAHEQGRAIGLIGWSLGGYLAREAARERPESARQVITLGSPVVGGPKYTAVADFYRRQGVDLDALEIEVEERGRTPLRTPVTAVYSRRDRVVAWRACIDRRTPEVEHVEVGTTHLGLGFSSEVYRIIAQRLARMNRWGHAPPVVPGHERSRLDLDGGLAVGPRQQPAGELGRGILQVALDECAQDRLPSRVVQPGETLAPDAAIGRGVDCDLEGAARVPGEVGHHVCAALGRTPEPALDRHEPQGREHRRTGRSVAGEPQRDAGLREEAFEMLLGPGTLSPHRRPPPRCAPRDAEC